MANTIKAVRETAKAIMIKAYVEYLDTDREVEYDLWVPKSQIKDGEIADWIIDNFVRDHNLSDFPKVGSVRLTLLDADDKKISSFSNITEEEKKEIQEKELQKQQKFNKAVAEREAVIKFLKEKGVKGVHSRMRTSTLQEIASQNGFDYNEIANQDAPKADFLTIQIGDLVESPFFGEGVVVAGDGAKFEVDFTKHGKKTILASKLKKKVSL